MASFRRTQQQSHSQTPAALLHDRAAYLNGGGTNSPLSSSFSPSQKLFPAGKDSFSSSAAAFLLHKRRGFRRSISQCLVGFLVGFLLGMLPFGRVDTDIRPHDLSFEIKPPHVNVQLDDHDTAISIDIDINSSKKRDDFTLNTVSLRVDDTRPPPSPSKQLIVITATYNRAMQAYFLNRLGQALRLVSPPLLWIVVEANAASLETAEILRKTGVMYRHLVSLQNSTSVKDRGVYQRNAALEHIERHRLDGIVYFADDDNVYSLELFESLRQISRFGTWPVAMLMQSKNKAILEGPVCNGSQVIGWHTNEKSKRLRRFHVDMSGFAFNSTILWDPKRWRRQSLLPIRQLDTVREGFQETTFIEQVVEDESQMEGIPPGCSRILNWHLHLDARGLVYPSGWMLKQNLDALLPVE